MRLYVKAPTGQKIYLKIKARTRTDLRQQIGRDTFKIRNVQYRISDVHAETGSNSLLTGAVIGGVIGLVGGPVGVVIGATAGGFLGNNEDDKDSAIVKRFNNSRNLWLRSGR